MLTRLVSLQRQELSAAALSLLSLIVPIDLLDRTLALLNQQSPIAGIVSALFALTGFFFVLKRSMVVRGLVFIPVYGLLVSMTAVAADIATSPEETFYLFRLAGAAMGASVAVIFKLRRRGDVAAAATMFFVGLTTGFVSSRWIIDKLGWPGSPDYWLLSSAIGGALGYMILQMIYSRKFAEKIRGRLTNE
jgi:hypothetical protein